MTERTVAVLALDAADYRLVTEWDCGNLMLDRQQPLEPSAHSFQYPHTMEMWPTIATGVPPEKHGLLASEVNDSDWKSGWLSLASRAANVALPSPVRTEIGRWLFESGFDRERSPPSLDLDHPFDDVYMWPGLTDAEHLAEVWEISSRVVEEIVRETEIEREMTRYAADEFAWLSSQPAGLYGAHCHYLDMMGHYYARDEEKLRYHYEKIDRFVGWLRGEVDELIIVSDHGMQVEWFDDESPGDHSFDAMISATAGIDDSLPARVEQVSEWLRGVRPDAVRADDQMTSDTTREQLEDLGYL